MTTFTNVIVRRPAKSMVEGITSAPELGKPDYELACKQHDDYIAALKDCGVEVTVLPALEQFPDSCFVEDPAVVTRCGAIITNPGAVSYTHLDVYKRQVWAFVASSRHRAPSASTATGSPARSRSTR